jgi:hypothetical protein
MLPTSALELEERARSIFRRAAEHGGELLDSPLELGYTLQCVVPARLQLTGDVALLRIHQLVSTTRQVHQDDIRWVAPMLESGR